MQTPTTNRVWSRWKGIGPSVLDKLPRRILLFVGCLLMLGSRAPEPSTAAISLPQPAQNLPEDIHHGPDSMASPLQAAQPLHPNSESLTKEANRTNPSANTSKGGIRRISRWQWVGAGIAYLLGLGLLGKALRERRNRRERKQGRPMHTASREFFQWVLVVLMGLAAIVGGTVIAMAIYSIALPAFGLALLATICTLVICGGIALVVYLLEEPNLNSGPSGTQMARAAKGCGMALFIIFILVPVSVLLGTVTFGLFLPLFCGVAFDFGAAVLSWLVLAALSFGAIYGSLRLMA